MNALLTMGAWNVALATVMAVLVTVLCRVPSVARRPALRHALWLLVLVKLVTPPVINVPILSASDFVPPTDDEALLVSDSPGDGGGAGLGTAVAERLIPTAPSTAASSRLDTETPATEPRERDGGLATASPMTSVQSQEETAAFEAPALRAVPNMLLVLSFLGTIVLFGRGWLRTQRLSRMLRRAGTREQLQGIAREAAATMGLAGNVEVSVVDGRICPLLWVGRTGPVIVLPAPLVDELDEEPLFDILRHELAHYVRRDHWSNGLAFVIGGLWWWNPVAWWARRELRAAQELCCDALVIDGSPATRRRYAETLLKVLEFLQTGPAVPAVGPGFGGSHTVRRRFEMIADTRLSGRWPVWTYPIVVCAAAVLPCVPACRAQNAAADSSPAEEESSAGETLSPADSGETVVSTLGGKEIPLRESTQFLLYGGHGAELRFRDDDQVLQLPARLNADAGARMRFTMTAIPEHPDLTLYGSLECVPRTPETTRFLEDNAITLELDEAHIGLAERHILTLYIFLPHQQPDEKWSGLLAHLDMVDVTADRHKSVLENLPKNQGFVLAVLRLGTRDPDANTGQDVPDHTTAGPDEPPDITFKDSEVTGEAIGQLAGRDWGTVSLMDVQFDGEIIERLRHAGSIHTLRLYGEGLSGQLPRLEHVRGLVDLEIGAPLNGRDLEAIGNLTRLERLVLPQELALTVTGARQIARLTNLKSLGLYNVDVDDASFAELATLVNLEELDLSHTRITDEGLGVLAGMPRLKSLDLRRHPNWYIAEQISDACVPVIAGLSVLERLSLSGNVTDAGLARIAELPRLTHLSIANTRISRDGLAALVDSNVESLTINPGQLGYLPPGIENDEDILRLMPGLDSIRKCRRLRHVHVHVNGEQAPGDDSEVWQRLAPKVSWSSSG